MFVIVSVFNALCLTQAVVVSPLEDYLFYFGGEANFSFQDLFTSSQAMQDWEFQEKLKQRVCAVGTADWKELLLPEERKRREEHLQLDVQDVALAKALPGDPSCYDLESSLARPRRAIGEQKLFTLISHGTLWNEQLQRPMMLEECLGVHTVATPSNPPGHRAFLLDELPVPLDVMACVREQIVDPATVKSCIGNGWHIATMTSWIMFVLASVEFRKGDSVPQPLTPPPVKRQKLSSSPCSIGNVDSPTTTEPDNESQTSSNELGSPWQHGTTCICGTANAVIELD